MSFINEADYFAKEGLLLGEKTNNHTFDEALNRILNIIRATSRISYTPEPQMSEESTKTNVDETE